MRINFAGEYVTLVGAAEILGTTREAVYHRVQRYCIPTSRIGRVVLIKTSDLPLLKKKRRG